MENRWRAARGRMRPRNWSLRARLVAGVVGLAAIALAATGSIGVTLLHDYLRSQLDQQLATLADRPGRVPGLPPRAPDGQLPTPFVFAEVGPDGTVVRQGGGSLLSSAHTPDLSNVTAAKVAAEHGRAFTVPSAGSGSGFRVRATAQPDGNSTVVAASTHSLDATVQRVELVTWLMALGAVILLVALAAVVVRLSLRPLTAVERTAGDIAEGDLSRRVPTGSPNTEIGRLSRTFNGMLARIESAFAEREHSEATLRQFIADASHELRTPLTTVRGYAELANKGALPDEASRQHALQRIEAESARMGGLVDDLLLLAYLDQQRPLVRAVVDLDLLVADAVADARARDPHRPVRYEPPEGSMPVDVDADRIRQMLGNLLANALVHTPPGTPVRARLARDGGTAIVTIADEGPGMPPEQVARVFERFYRADPSRSRARGGSGLGLAIVQAVVSASGGTVSCASSPGVGTAFTVRLPLVSQ